MISVANSALSTVPEVVRDEVDLSFNLEYAGHQAGDAEHMHADSSTAEHCLDDEPTRLIRPRIKDLMVTNATDS